MNNVVSFEIAKLLKEKGFDEETRSAYQINGNSTHCDPSYYSGLGNRQGFRWWNSKEIDYYSAPTIAQVVMWLYETHNTWIDVPFWDSNFKYKIVSVEFEKVLKSMDLEGYNSPADAYKAAIDYTLKNLI